MFDLTYSIPINVNHLTELELIIAVSSPIVVLLMRSSKLFARIML